MKDAIIILGCSNNDDGTISDLLRKRVDEGVRLYKSGKASKLIMSGKHGLFLHLRGQVPSNSESSVMKKYAVSLGVPAENILIEDESKDTLGNAYFTKVRILEPHNWYNCFLVTSDYHIDRTRSLFDFVLGPKYSIEFIGTDSSSLPDEKVEKMRVQEKKTTKVFREIIGDNIIKGDTNAIGEMLLLKHPGYSKNPEYSYERLEEMLHSK